MKLKGIIYKHKNNHTHINQKNNNKKVVSGKNKNN